MLPAKKNGVNSALISPSKQKEKVDKGKKKVEMLSDRVHITLPILNILLKVPLEY